MISAGERGFTIGFRLASLDLLDLLEQPLERHGHVLVDNREIFDGADVVSVAAVRYHQPRHSIREESGTKRTWRARRARVRRHAAHRALGDLEPVHVDDGDRPILSDRRI